MSIGPGHNGGPTMEPGYAWRRHVWTRARADLLPHLPLEVLRLRVGRAQALGLDYRTYASVRAASGHDVVAFLFSSNALRVFPGREMPPDRHARLAATTGAVHVGLSVLPLTPEALAAAGRGVLAATHPAPAAFAPFPEMRARLGDAIRGLPRDGVVLVGDTGSEREWTAAGRLAFYLPAARYFDARA